MRKIPVLALALGALASIAGAEAATQCGPHEQLTQQLGQRFQESRQAIGLSGSAAVVELYVSSQGSWTMISTNARGLACVLATGEAWQVQEKPVQGVSL
ncbi:MAG: hypothetical protein ACKVP5_23615 [Aestuariivirga sp.]